MIGILLAGGAATRLPNKPLLPQRNYEPVCFSGMDCLRRHDVKRIVVVTPPNSVIVDIINDSYVNLFDNISFVYQEEPTGVGDAINCCEEEGEERLIVAADNIYPETEIIDYNGIGLKAVVRPVDPWRLPHLVTYNEATKRLLRGGSGKLALTSPWFAPIAYTFTSLGWRDFEKGQLEERPAEGWWDVGTIDTYTTYWRSR